MGTFLLNSQMTDWMVDVYLIHRKVHEELKAIAALTSRLLRAFSVQYFVDYHAANYNSNPVIRTKQFKPRNSTSAIFN